MSKFVILKSYDGGKHWERERWCPDFTTAADAAQKLRTRNRAARFRVDVQEPSHLARPVAAGQGGGKEIGSP